MAKGARSGSIVIVSGLPRSGTSMMMAALQAGGFPLLQDHLRRPDDDNPQGYFEFEPVKKLKNGETRWLDAAAGRVVKVISYLLPELPPHHRYDVVFMRRRLEEVLASQRQMLERKGEDPDKVDQAELEAIIKKHLEMIEDWISRQSNVRAIYIDYNKMLTGPDEELDRLNVFFHQSLDQEAMRAVIDPDLYRQRLGS